jgi:hypothetical protein
MNSNFLGVIFIVLFWCAFLCSVIGAALDLFHISSYAIFLWRAAGISVLVDGIILWCAK